ncbi:MAG: hypothetical protein LBP52_06465 [Burkholderiaceae bacterium]|nr:hypothetical protein [Burkholderiaceae bacterium]
MNARTLCPRLGWMAAAWVITLTLMACSDAPDDASASAPSESITAASAPASAASAAAPVATRPVSYHAARYDPIHFKPAIEQASDQQCLACHAEVLQPAVRKTSIAGVAAADAKAWYQALSTYQGAQDTFHRRHLETPLARQLMRMKCNTCHQGNDPRDEAPGTSASFTGQQTLRKMVSAESMCLRCHGTMNWPVMTLPEPWPKIKDSFQNNCLMCHTVFRTNRHQVNYLNAEAIEEAAAKPNGGDVCYGCHGGRAWYRINFPYPRHPWPGMDTSTTPDWAKDRPTESEIRFLIATTTGDEKK